jgi:hypothetical protein
MPMGRMCLLCVYATIPTMGMPHDVDMQYADVFLGAPLGTVLYAEESHASELPQLRIGPPRTGPCVGTRRGILVSGASVCETRCGVDRCKSVSLSGGRLQHPLL